MMDIRIHGVGKYELLNDVHVSVNGWDITVYKGFVWDGASIPHNLWDEIGCPLDYAIESLVHDALYRTNLLDRKTADKIFHALLSRRDDVGAVVAKIMYLGVRACGSGAYDGSSTKAADRAYVRAIKV